MPRLKGWNAGHMNEAAHAQWDRGKFYTNQYHMYIPAVFVCTAVYSNQVVWKTIAKLHTCIVSLVTANYGEYSTCMLWSTTITSCVSWLTKLPLLQAHVVHAWVWMKTACMLQTHFDLYQLWLLNVQYAFMVCLLKPSHLPLHLESQDYR